MAPQRVQPKCSLCFGVDLKIAGNRRIETEIVTAAPEKKRKALHMTVLHSVTVEGLRAIRRIN